MPTAWTAYTAGQVLSAPGPGPVIEQLHTSAFERLRAAFGDSWAASSGFTPYPMPTAGQPFLNRVLWGDAGNAAVGGLAPIDNALFFAGLAQYPSGGGDLPFATNALGMFIDHRAAIEGAAGPPPYWTMPTIRDAAGLPLTKFFNLSGGSLVEDASKRKTQMKRVRYRQIVLTTDAKDTEGNAAAVGQRAFGASPPIANAAVYGNRYRHNGAAWVRDESAQADLIDNTQDPPNTVQGNAWGPPLLGDVAGLWLFEERRLVMDLMRWTMLPFSGLIATDPPNFVSTAGGDTGIPPSGAPYSTDTAAEAALATAYAGVTPGAWTDLPRAWNSLSRTKVTGGDSWGANGRKTDGNYSPALPLSAMAKKWNYFAKGDDVPQAENAHDTFVFDTQGGDPVQNGVYHAWISSVGPDVATAPASGVWGNLAAFPANYTDPAAPASIGDTLVTLRGYAVTDMLLVCKWNVAGGYSYSSATD